METIDVDDVSEILAYEDADSGSQPRPQRSPTHMMLANNAKPRGDLSPEEAARVAKTITKLNKRLRRQRREEKRRKKRSTG